MSVRSLVSAWEKHATKTPQSSTSSSSSPLEKQGSSLQSTTEHTLSPDTNFSSQHSSLSNSFENDREDTNENSHTHGSRENLIECNTKKEENGEGKENDSHSKSSSCSYVEIPNNETSLLSESSSNNDDYHDAKQASTEIKNPPSNHDVNQSTSSETQSQDSILYGEDGSLSGSHAIILKSVENGGEDEDTENMNISNIFQLSSTSSSTSFKLNRPDLYRSYDSFDVHEDNRMDLSGASSFVNLENQRGKPSIQRQRSAPLSIFGEHRRQRQQDFQDMEGSQQRHQRRVSMNDLSRQVPSARKLKQLFYKLRKPSRSQPSRQGKQSMGNSLEPSFKKPLSGCSKCGTKLTLTCSVCFCRQVDVVLIPCGHIGVCRYCWYNSRKFRCPFCRTLVDDVKRIFLAVADL